MVELKVTGERLGFSETIRQLHPTVDGPHAGVLAEFVTSMEELLESEDL
ncbi:hypothetical protein TELCIR_17301 [Teladorsagia circumcincta]|uniref:Uncharacterized protein n=1 Tax=Teladorsagia circumcincta TaxID=45464 RepID=A0A2G9TT72_TELCI|nr:hypothetical protein TELCIR_17301 [Teladorsagia circumcincta]